MLVGALGRLFLMSDVVRVQYGLPALLSCRQDFATTFPLVTVRLNTRTLLPT